MQKRGVPAIQKCAVVLSLSLLSFFSPGVLLVAHAQSSTSTVQQQIDQSNAQISALEGQIAQLQSELDATSQQKLTLQNAVTGLNLNIQKVTKSITLTNAQIAQKDRQISTLSGTIATTSAEITQSQLEVADSLRQLNMLDAEPLAEVLLGGGTLSSFFDDAETLSALRSSIEGHVQVLGSEEDTLQTSKSNAETQRQQLATLEANLGQQKQSLAIARTSQTQLLSQTKDKESNYQALIAEKKSEEAQFEQELLQFEGQLTTKVNPTSLPPAGPVLAWPLSSIRITQYFGATAFATENPQIYDGHGHTGIDLAASPGTPVHAARAGVVVATGDTDLTCPYASFGRYIFIQHDDGLSTLYAHLSVIGVKTGQQVSTGEVIGYSDTTGYATGPHLHFGVYASAATVVEQLPTALKCKLVIPVAPLSAYLNPLTYLPAI